MIRAGLTKRQEQVFNVIRDRLATGRVPPSYKELCEALNLNSRSSISRAVNCLEARGYLKKTRYGGARSLAVLPGAEDYVLHLEGGLHEQLRRAAAERATTPENIIMTALEAYLGRRS